MAGAGGPAEGERDVAGSHNGPTSPGEWTPEAPPGQQRVHQLVMMNGEVVEVEVEEGVNKPPDIVFCRHCLHRNRMKRQFLVGGNWKCNGSLDLVQQYARLDWNDVDDAQVIVALPYPYLLAAIKAWPSALCVAAQDVSGHEKGAFTGE